MTATPGSNPRAKAILDAIRSHPQLPGLAANIGRIVAIADSENESIQELRDVILADVHLTQRILAIANSVGYRLHSGSGVSTISKAIVVIGFEQVKVIALGMMFVDQIPDQERAAAMKGELIRALQASLLAREMSRQLAPDDKEKAGIAALLGNVARLLLVMIDYKRYVEISRRVEAGATEAAASFEVLGMSVETLTKEVLTLWGIPDTLVALSTGTSSMPVESKQLRRLGRIVRLAATTAQHLRHPESPERDVLIGEVRSECLSDGGVTAEAFDRWMAAADAQLRPVRALFKAATPGPAAPDEGFPEGTVIDTSAPVTGQLNAVGKPANSRELVLSRLQDVTDLIAQGQGLTATLRTALECLHIRVYPLHFAVARSGHAANPCAPVVRRRHKSAGESPGNRYRHTGRLVRGGGPARVGSADSECPRPENCSAPPALFHRSLSADRQLHRPPHRFGRLADRLHSGRP
jgi:HD-like signal output (HDOD) protein